MADNFAPEIPARMLPRLDDRNRTLTTMLDALPPEQAAAVIAALPALEALSLGLTS